MHRRTPGHFGGVWCCDIVVASPTPVFLLREGFNRGASVRAFQYSSVAPDVGVREVVEKIEYASACAIGPHDTRHCTACSIGAVAAEFGAWEPGWRVPPASTLIEA